MKGLALVGMLIPNAAFAQVSVRAWGIGGTGVATARVLDAIAYNPANLAFSEGFSNTSGEGYALGSAVLSYGGVLHPSDNSQLNVGLNAKYPYGTYEMHVEEAYGTMSTTMDEISGEAYVSTITSDGGQGYGMDLGMAYQTASGWNLGLSIENLYTTVTWDQNGTPHPARTPRMRFLLVRPVFFLRLPSDPTSRWQPLPLS